MNGDSGQSQMWLMQPRWVPVLRAAIGVAIGLCAIAALVLVWPWEGLDLLLLGWLALGVFLVWASRFEHSGTRVDADAITVSVGRTVRRLDRQDILDLRLDAGGWRVQALLRDGEEVTLLGVPVGEVDRLRDWHLRPSG